MVHTNLSFLPFSNQVTLDPMQNFVWVFKNYYFDFDQKFKTEIVTDWAI